MTARRETEEDFIKEKQFKFLHRFCQETELMPQMQKLQDVEDVPSLNPDPDTYPTQCLCCNGEDQHTERTLLKRCTVRLVDFRKIPGLSAKIISEGNLHIGVSGDSHMFDGDKQPLQAQLKMNSVRSAVDCGKIQSRKATAERQPEEGAYCHKYNPSNFISSSEYIVAVLWMNANGPDVCGMHSK
ncbi:hypothetical protein PDJAM_G00112100 [Pangasius djambal]|uniref:Uncharacterized protein n=1 Tax=Pangasius djambal TaxID=1691987 RepID=A0ACC5Y2J5_9TELE|nr:hypothetical protein [Pangasius djambal]